MAKASDLEKVVIDKHHERKIRNIGLPFGQMTSQRAKTYGFNLARWRRIINSAMVVDHRKISVFGQKLASKLERASKVHVSANNGTDLNFDISGRPVHLHDGIVDEANMSKGTFSESLPSGYVAIAPLENSAEGGIRFDKPTAVLGKLVKRLKSKFQNERIS